MKAKIDDIGNTAATVHAFVARTPDRTGFKEVRDAVTALILRAPWERPRGGAVREETLEEITENTSGLLEAMNELEASLADAASTLRPDAPDIAAEFATLLGALHQSYRQAMRARVDG